VKGTFFIHVCFRLKSAVLAEQFGGGDLGAQVFSSCFCILACLVGMTTDGAVEWCRAVEVRAAVRSLAG